MTGAANENPAAGERARGALGSCNERDHSTASRSRAKASLTISWGEGEAATTATFNGREAQTLALLIQCGSRGFTSGDASPLGWARRTSHYVHRLRAAGLEISTTWERAGDARVGRYTLETPSRVIEWGGCG
jgi:hypothetical protein